MIRRAFLLLLALPAIAAAQTVRVEVTNPPPKPRVEYRVVQRCEAGQCRTVYVPVTLPPPTPVVLAPVVAAPAPRMYVLVPERRYSTPVRDFFFGR